MDYISQTVELVEKINKVASSEKKKSGFLIGNTAKIDKEGLYFTPLRMTNLMVIGGIIVYSESQAIEITQAIDGKVDYVLVDAEKKVPNKMSVSGEPANIERAVRETLNKSNLWVYKANDLSVEAVDALLGYLYKGAPGGLGGKKVVVIGCGNIGSKLALKLVERAADVVITRRDQKKLKIIADAINCIMPKYTKARVDYSKNNELAIKDADVLIGATNGVSVITADMLRGLNKNAIILDVGKGSLKSQALEYALENKIDIYRIDVTAAISGMIETQWMVQNIIENKMGRRKYKGERLVAGGLLGMKGEIIVDNISNPKVIYGIADGKGDFIRLTSNDQKRTLQRLEKIL